jgi:hypothetical protein
MLNVLRYLMLPDSSHIILFCLAAALVAAQAEVQCIPFQETPTVKEKKMVVLTLLGASDRT